ncbi:PREDICTED: hemicentin-1-like [Priapulus caudatus]|uniref:Hemicentin-1-like n=1 Tax=Priapulus caudatus TaxID=37621 RepID=A0ABM1E1Z8_PRICU|nr:PREDICTED: hemicentin-1-like [Priapulus caudatus]
MVILPPSVLFMAFFTEGNLLGNVTVHVNDTVNLTCTAKNVKPAPDFLFYKYRPAHNTTEQITENIYPAVVSPASSAADELLLIVSKSLSIVALTTDDDESQIICQAVHAGLQIGDPAGRTSTQLSVEFKPIVKSNWPAKLEYVSGTSVTILCYARGNPAPEFTWMKDNRTFQNGAVLSISEIEESDQGRYTCVAFNKYGLDRSDDVPVIVIDTVNAGLILAMVIVAIVVMVVVVATAFLVAKNRVCFKQKDKMTVTAPPLKRFKCLCLG